jgi:hypothetical protein
MTPDKNSLNNKDYFRKCPCCGFKWESREGFLCDPNIYIIGYQADFEELTTGLFYFNHSCKGTLTIRAHYFNDLYDGPIFEERATRSDLCPGHCLHLGELDPCPAECECAYVREIVQIIKAWSKKVEER